MNTSIGRLKRAFVTEIDVGLVMRFLKPTVVRICRAARSVRVSAAGASSEGAQHRLTGNCLSGKEH